MEGIITRLESELEEVEGGAEAKIRRFVELHFRIGVEHPELAEFITVELRQSAKFVKEYDNPKFGRYLEILTGLIEEGQREGVFCRELDARLVGRSVFGALDEVLLQLTLSAQRPDGIEREVEQVSRMLLDGLRT
jgi:TetR/AcrR family fatty acid metabolism transcriptional regulator